MAFAEGVPTVEVQLDKPRSLGFTLGSMRRSMEERRKRNVPEDAPEALTLALDVWACLDGESRAEISIEQIEEMVHVGNIKAVSASFAELFRLSNPDGEAGADQAQEPTQAGPRLAANG